MNTRAVATTGKSAIHFIELAAQTLSQRADFHFRDLF